MKRRKKRHEIKKNAKKTQKKDVKEKKDHPDHPNQFRDYEAGMAKFRPNKSIGFCLSYEMIIFDTDCSIISYGIPAIIHFILSMCIVPFHLVNTVWTQLLL